MRMASLTGKCMASFACPQGYCSILPMAKAITMVLAQIQGFVIEEAFIAVHR
jgi:hypothetical protein